MKYIISITLIFSSLISVAQSLKAVKGIVKDAASHSPIGNVSVQLNNESTGTITNNDGFFILNLPVVQQSDSIVLSCMGYKTISMTLKDFLNAENNTLNIYLPPETYTLNDIVIKSLSLKEILDSIENHNHSIMLSPALLTGYYREFVFTNDTCNEFSDAILKYYITRKNKDLISQTKIEESRYKKSKKYDDKNNTIFIDSRINPNSITEHSFLNNLRKKYFTDKMLENYKYKIEYAGKEQNDGLIKLTIFPKEGISISLYKAVFVLSSKDFSICSYKLEIPASLIQFDKVRNLLGLHAQLNKYSISATYEKTGNGIYVKYTGFDYSKKIWGKFLGVKLNQVIEQKSEFVTTDVNTENVSPFPKKDVYTKGNICKNGNTLDDALLGKINFIVPSRTDSTAIQAIQ